MYDIISMPATHDGIWNSKTILPQNNAVILTVFMHDPVASNCSDNTDFHASSQDSASCQSISHFGDITWYWPLPTPPQITLSYSTLLRTVGLRLKDGSRKIVHANIDILHSEFGSIWKGSVKKYCNVLWHISVVSVGVLKVIVANYSVSHLTSNY
jgi:hypothetical protein